MRPRAQVAGSPLSPFSLFFHGLSQGEMNPLFFFSFFFLGGQEWGLRAEGPFFPPTFSPLPGSVYKNDPFLLSPSSMDYCNPPQLDLKVILPSRAFFPPPPPSPPLSESCPFLFHRSVAATLPLSLSPQVDYMVRLGPFQASIHA